MLEVSSVWVEKTDLVVLVVTNLQPRGRTQKEIFKFRERSILITALK